MATIDELYFHTLGRDVERIDMELARLEEATKRPGGGRDRAAVTRRIEAAARTLQGKLDQESATLWMLFQEPARHSQIKMMHQRIGRMFDRILALLRPQQLSHANDSLADKVQKIQQLHREIGGHKTIQQTSMPDPAYWQHSPVRGLEADPWSSLVLLSAVLFDFVHVMMKRSKH